MTNRDERIQRLFAETLDVPAEDREAFLQQACGDDPAAKDEVLRMVGVAAPRLPLLKLLAGRFRVTRFLATGGMGDVYEVEDLELGEQVALKTIRPEVVRDPQMLARFKREIQYAKRVTHPNVCRIHDLGTHQEGGVEILFLTMELLRGETLSHRLRKSGKMAPPVALPLIVQMAEGLAAAHEAGIIHRDFKTSNVMLTSSDAGTRAVVTDFGLARPSAVGADATLTESGRLVGTPAYMAPEQLTHGELTSATDVYALGLVIYEMISGKRPFSGDTPLASALKRLTHDAPAVSDQVPGLDPAWESAIKYCLQREPRKRFQNPKDVVRALTENSGPTQSLTANWMRIQSRKSSRAGIVVLAGVAAFAAALGGVWLWGRHRPPNEAMRWYEEGTRALRDGTSYTAMNALDRAVQLDPEFSLAHGRLAEAATELDYMDKAKTEMLRATPPAFQSFFLSSQEKLRLEAVYFVLVKDFAHAAAKYKELAEKTESSERPAILVDLGRAYESAGKIPDALASYTESISGDRQFPAAFLRRAVLEGRQQMTAKAAADFDAAEQLYRTEGKAEGLIEVLYQRASLLRRTGRLAEARLPSQTALEMARASGDDYHQIRALLALSQLSYTSGDIDGGQRLAQQAIDLAHKSGIEVLAASGLTDIGNALFTKGDNAAAEPYLRNAIQTAQRLGAARIEARAQVTLGQVLAKEGRTEEAVAVIKQATASFQQSGEKGNSARAAIPAARMLRDQGDYEASANLFRHQLQLAEQVKDDGAVIYSAQGLGSVLLVQEQYPSALAIFERSALVSHAIADLSGEAYSEIYRAEALWRLGQYSAAAERLKVAEALISRLNGNKPLTLNAYTARAGMDLSRGNFPDAEEDLRKIAEASGSPVIIKRTLGLVRLSTGRVKEGRTLCEESVRLAEASRNIAAIKNSELALAEARLDSGDVPGAFVLASSLSDYFAGKNQLESELRALALAVSSGKEPEKTKYSDRAKSTFAALRQGLGESAATFDSRPDIRQVIRRAGLIIDTK